MSSSRRLLIALVTLVMLMLVAGCSDRDPSSLAIARANIDPLVFGDAFGGDVYPQPFGGTYYEALSIDTDNAQSGSASVKVIIPGNNSALGGYAGGVFTSVGARDLADFNALTFYARSSINSTLNEAGFGNDNTGTSLFSVSRLGIPLTTDWTFVVIPIPNSSRLIAERGLFTYSEGFEPQSSQGHTLWFDEVRFSNLSNITNTRGIMPALTKEYFVGAKARLTTSTIFEIDGADVTVGHSHNYFDFQSTNAAVANVVDGEVQVVGVGDAIISATLAGEPVEGSVTLTGHQGPAAPAPAPTHNAADVVCLFSDTYTNTPVSTWAANWQWSTAEAADFDIGDETAIMYTSLNFCGVDFKANTIDISDMTHMHVDVFVPEGTNFRVKIIAFNADNGGIVGQRELTFDADSTPALQLGAWTSLEIPMEDFAFTSSLEHVGQLSFSTLDATLVLVDNVYWHR